MSETPLLFLLPPCFLSSSSLPLARAGSAPNPSAPPPSRFADPVRKPRREVSDPLPFSSRYVRSLMYSHSSLEWPGFWPICSSLIVRPVVPLPLRANKAPATAGQRGPPWLPVAPPALSAPGVRDRVRSRSMESTNVGWSRITARLRLPTIL